MAATRQDELSLPSAMTLLVADDRPVIRAGLVALLAPLSVADAVSLEELPAAVDEIAPDLLVVGVRDDDQTTFAAVAGITSQRRGLPVVAVADSATVIELREAVIAGIGSFLLTSTSGQELRDAVERTAAGERVVSSSIAMQLAGTWHPGEATSAAASVTRQELEVLELAADGLTNDAIATELGIGARTVKTRIQNLLSKLDVPDRTAAVARAMRLGLIS